MNSTDDLATAVQSNLRTEDFIRLAGNWDRIRSGEEAHYGTLDQRPWRSLFTITGDAEFDRKSRASDSRMEDDSYLALISELSERTGLTSDEIDRALVVLADPVLASFGILKGAVSQEQLEQWRIEDEAAELRREKLLDDIMEGKKEGKK